MPAYRSPAEAEIRDAVVARVRQHRPDARIIHEINACDFGNRIDVLAVDRAEIIAIEVKSAKDKLDRLPAQIKAMNGAAHHVIAALHEKFLVPARWAHRVPGSVEPPSEAKGATVWAFPEAGAEVGRAYGCAAWEMPRLAINAALPQGALRILWRDELYALCGQLRIDVGRRATMPEMSKALRWHCTGAELTRGICAALRARRCVEADPEIIERIAA